LTRFAACDKIGKTIKNHEKGDVKMETGNKLEKLIIRGDGKGWVEATAAKNWAVHLIFAAMFVLGAVWLLSMYNEADMEMLARQGETGMMTFAVIMFRIVPVVLFVLAAFLIIFQIAVNSARSKQYISVHENGIKFLAETGTAQPYKSFNPTSVQLTYDKITSVEAQYKYFVIVRVSGAMYSVPVGNSASEIVSVINVKSK